MMLRIVPVGDDGETYRAPDLVFDGVIADLVVNGLDHAEAPGDFQAEQGLATQVLICLMTDARVHESELRDGDENRGWFGDGFDLAKDETAIGSRLWLLRRSALVDGIEQTAEDYARAALQPLLDQKAVSRIDVSATATREKRRLDLSVSLYGRAGSVIYSQRFALLWDQASGLE
ncbi:phage GP46 family protein [Martelella sp. HB161492]|uniref:phage GP46 family protein n=1 Tax=Martelella sp. HB161492 TaxID=2720726 RepID=UPI001FED2C3A|nr:phage GP46 family protein [Martelella sp. HB161492]